MSTRTHLDLPLKSIEDLWCYSGQAFDFLWALESTSDQGDLLYLCFHHTEWGDGLAAFREKSLAEKFAEPMMAHFACGIRPVAKSIKQLEEIVKSKAEDGAPLNAVFLMKYQYKTPDVEYAWYVC